MSSTSRDAVLAAADAVEASRELLCELDAAAGDGDHGVTMAIGARAVRRNLDASGMDDPVAVTRQAALGMGAAGGAIGPIWAAGLLAVAGVLDRARGADGGIVASTALAREAADAACSAVGALGHAKRGDKTILDALIPACEALASAEAAGTPLAEAAAEAAAAARAGAVGTAGMIATIGRAARLGERSRGTPDPGATSLALVLGALAATIPAPGPGG